MAAYLICKFFYVHADHGRARVTRFRYVRGGTRCNEAVKRPRSLLDPSITRSVWYVGCGFFFLSRNTCQTSGTREIGGKT